MLLSTVMLMPSDKSCKTSTLFHLPFPGPNNSAVIWAFYTNNSSTEIYFSGGVDKFLKKKEKKRINT